MHKFLSLLVVLGLSTSALASNTKVLATCLGSYSQTLSPAEPVEIALENGQIWVRPTMSSCFPQLCMSLEASKAGLKASKNTIQALHERRKLGFTTFRKTLNIDLNTGYGVATHYEAFESLVKAKKIYLKECEK